MTREQIDAMTVSELLDLATGMDIDIAMELQDLIEAILEKAE